MILVSYGMITDIDDRCGSKSLVNSGLRLQRSVTTKPDKRNLWPRDRYQTEEQLEFRNPG